VPKGILCNQLKHIPCLAGCPLSPKGATRYLKLLGGTSSPSRPSMRPKVRLPIHIVLPLAVHGYRPSFDAAPLLPSPQGCLGGFSVQWGPLVDHR